PLLVIAVVIAAALMWQPEPTLPPEELNRARLERLMEQKAILHAELTPRGFENVYEVAGTYAKNSEKVDFTITTHLTDEQVRALMDRPGCSLAVPRTSARSRLVELAPTLVIAALVIGVLLYQTTFSRGKGGHKV